MASCSETHFGNDPWIFQNDNCPCHMSQRAKNWKNQNNIPYLDWLSQSPDLNVIENVWNMMKIRFAREQHRIKTRQNLVEAVMRIWTSFTPGYIKIYQTDCVESLKLKVMQKSIEKIKRL
jgi:hypothetical protein